MAKYLPDATIDGLLSYLRTQLTGILFHPANNLRGGDQHL